MACCFARETNRIEQETHIFFSYLRLCSLANAIQPGAVSKVNKQKMPFMKMENINAYLTACQNWGLKSSDCFQTVDLFEQKNMVAVVTNILAVKRLKG
jgi:hypothetical protein